MKMNVIKIGIFVFAAIMLEVSCTKELVTEQAINLLDEQCSPMTKSVDTTFCNDSILPYPEGERYDLSLKYGLARANSIYDDIYSLRDLPINIVVKENIQGGGRYLTTQGKGGEVVFSGRKDDRSQQFYIKALPLTSGIPYMIYSMSTETPMSVGYYKSAPDTPVLYMMDGTGSSWGASWDFYSGNIDGALVIKNNDIMEGGPNYWDMYNVVIGAAQNNVFLDKYNKLATQQFDLVPLEEFDVTAIEFINDATASFTQTPGKVLKDSYVNNSDIAQSYSLTISEEVTETSSFTHKGSISVSVSVGFKVKAPCIAEGTISTTGTTSYEVTYGETTTNRRTISRSYPVNIPARNRAQLTIALSDDTIDMNYVATCVGRDSGRIIQQYGTWQGVSVSQGDAILTIEPLNARASAQKYIFDEETELWIPLS